MANLATSFISEHTAEYYLVFALKNILLKKYKVVTPIFPWLQREGSRISREIHKNLSFNIVGLYPRRPKIVKLKSHQIKVKLNAQIFAGAKQAKLLGIPVFAGVPFARDFLELGSNPKCFWFKLNLENVGDRIFTLDTYKGIVEDITLKEILLKNETDLFNYIEGQSCSMDWDKAMEAFRKIKMSSSGNKNYHPFLFIGGYKPLYFLLHEKI